MTGKGYVVLTYKGAGGTGDSVERGDADKRRSQDSTACYRRPTSVTAADDQGVGWAGEGFRGERERGVGKEGEEEEGAACVGEGRGRRAGGR
eukprot:321990-Rhodomonas_salina.1